MNPLDGIRVLDLTNVLAGPFCCHQLAHLGADVIKVEAVGHGDLARQLGADADLNAARMGVSFLAQNAGKRSVTANLKHPDGKALFFELVQTADVVVENFRPGVMDRLGLGWPTLREQRPSLVYCAISGFGQDGPWRDLPAYDQIIQGCAGVMSVTGEPDGSPLRVGYPVCDTIGGLTAAFAISAALNGRERNGGAFIDVSMLESTLATMGWVVSNWLIAGVRPAAHGNENMTAAPSGTFETADGQLNIAANKDEQWLALCAHLDRNELARDPRFATRELRKSNRARLKAELEASLRGKSARQWSAELGRLGIPSGPVLEVPDVLDHPQIAARGMLADFADVPGVGRDIRLVRTGIKIDGTAPAVDAPPPQLGAHNDEVYGALGHDRATLDALRAAGAI